MSGVSHCQRSLWMPILETASLSVFAILLLSLARRVSDEMHGWWDYSWAAIAMPLGYLLADLASGTVHWFCDTFFEEDSPVIGRLLIHPFREHHRDPLAMTRHGFFELTGNSAMMLLLPLALNYWRPLPAGPAILLGWWCLAMFSTNLFHRWAHLPQPPGAVQSMQHIGLILPPSHHQRHHSGDGRMAYCVTNGWINLIADRIHLFRHLERLFRAAGLPVSRAA